LKAAESERVGHSASAQKEQESRFAEEAASANARLADLQKKLDAEGRARSEESSRAATLEAKLGERGLDFEEVIAQRKSEREALVRMWRIVRRMNGWRREQQPNYVQVPLMWTAAGAAINMR